MRIMQVVDIGWLAGGAERSVMGLSDYLISQGHSVLIVSTDKNSADRELFADLVIPAIAGGPFSRLRDYAFYRTAYRTLRQAIADFEPDVIHYHTVGELSPSALFAARGVPYILTVHGPEDFTLGLLPWHLPPRDYRNHSYRWSDITVTGRLRYAYLRWLQRPIYLVALRSCAAYVAPSRFMAEVLKEEAPPGMIEQIYNGIELPERRPLSVGHRLLFVGRLEPVKGADVLLRAFQLVVAERPDAQLAVLGDGEQYAALRELARELGIEAAVRFGGWVDDVEVRAALRACTALVIPSVWPENMPTVALEAIAVGRAIIASRVGGVPELVNDGRTGLLVDSTDIASLAAALDRVLGDEALARRMGTEAGAARGRFSLEVFTAKTLALYEKVTAAA